MADQLYLSYWIRGFTQHNALRHFEGVLKKFPFSRLLPKASLTIYAVNFTEPPLLMREFAGEIDTAEILTAARDFQAPDCAYEIESAWELWRQVEGEWKLAPAHVVLTCHGPMFPSELGEQIRIEFGHDSQFLPQRNVAGSLDATRHNIKSLLHLVKDLDDTIAVDKRQLWSESGENFAERLQSELQRGEVIEMPPRQSN